MKRLDLHPAANDEVIEALSYYGFAEDGTPNDLKDGINLALDSIASYPQQFPFWNKTRFKRCVIGRYPYVIFYDDEPGRVHILAVAHTIRRPGYWQKRIVG